MVWRIARWLGYWWAILTHLLTPPRRRKVSPSAATPPDHPMCRCVVVPIVSEDGETQTRSDAVQRLIIRPMVRKGDVGRSGDPMTGKVNMFARRRVISAKRRPDPSDAYDTRRSPRPRSDRS